MPTADEALGCLKEVIKSWPELSEADTRCKIIDPLFKCLGWNEEDIIREEHTDAGFVDYIFKTPDISFFVLEAKKNGVSFELPGNLTNRRYKIGATISTDKSLIGAIEQAQRYCVEKGLRFGIVSNGSQFVIFEAFKYGASWRDGKCMLFYGFEDILENFTLFWNILNKSSVQNASLKKYLSDEKEGLQFKRIIDEMHNKDETLIRNPLNPYLKPMSERIFMDITGESQVDMLRKCYVCEKAHDDANETLKAYLRERISRYSEKYNIRSFFENREDAGKFQESFEKSEEFLGSGAQEGRLILLLGGVGCGKTTFLHYFYRVLLDHRKDLIWLYVNCLDSPIGPEKVEEFIYRRILDDFKARYLPKLREKLEEVKIESLRAEYRDIVVLFAILRYLGYSTTLMLDNVDQQRRILTLQEQIFLLAKHLATKLNAVHVLSLREESYFRSTLKGAFDAYYIEKFHIPPPQFERMIESRLDYAIELLESPNDQEMPRKIEISPSGPERSKILDFLRILRDSIGRKSPMRMRLISSFITSVSMGNMRRALEIFDNFLSSGNTNITEMFDIFRRTGGYQIPYHAFVKSVMLGHRRYYSGNASYIMNLFDLAGPHGTSHFTHLRILKYAHDRLYYDSPIGRGFVDIDSLKLDAEKVGMDLRSIDDSLNTLSKLGLIEFDRMQSDVGTASHFTITPTGIYYRRELIWRFIYLDLVWQDTPLSDPDLAKHLRDVIDKRDLHTRLERVEKFLDYLLRAEDREFTISPEYREIPLTASHFMRDIIAYFRVEKQYVISSKKKRRYIATRLEEPDELDTTATAA